MRGGHLAGKQVDYLGTLRGRDGEHRTLTLRPIRRDDLDIDCSGLCQQLWRELAYHDSRADNLSTYRRTTVYQE
jgi:hypothetical protein